MTVRLLISHVAFLSKAAGLYNGGFSPPDRGFSGLIGFLIRFIGSLTISPTVSPIVTVTV